MNPTVILIFILIVSILYVLVQRHKKEERERLEKSKKAVANLMKIIPKKMKKIMKKSNETFPTGAVKLASTIASGDNSKIIEAFEDIKDIRYGKIGASNHNGGDTINKWIKVASFTVSGAWDPRGFTLEVYPRIRYHTSGRQTLVCLVRNAAADIEAPYVSVITHNESEANTRLIKDVRVIRTGGSGISGNTMEVWIQFGQSWADTAYVMYYLYNFGTKDFVATVPQAQQNAVPAGQAWGISDQIEPQNGKYQIKGTKVKIGDKWTLSGVGDAHGNDDWLRLFGADEKGYYGGLAANKLYTPELHIPGNVYSTMNVTGGNIGHESGGHEFRHANRTQGIGLGYNTIYATGSNTDQDLGLKARGAGKVRVTGEAVVNGKLSLNRNALNFSNAEWDKNHNIYNNGYNIDKEGGWDGMKINSYAGLKVRMGDSNNPNNPPKTVLEATGAGTIVGPDNKQKCNDWIFHTPGDGRRMLYVAPKRDNGDGTCGDWEWNKQVTIDGNDGATRVNKLKLGNKWTMSGVGDAHGNDDWLRLFSNDEGGYYGGFAAGRLWTGQGYLAGSDRKMKENIKKVDKKDMLDKVSKLNGYLYNLKEDKEKKKKYGVIAQEIAKEFPEMVEKGPNGLLAVDYNQLIGVLLESIKELNEKCSKKKK